MADLQCVHPLAQNDHFRRQEGDGLFQVKKELRGEDELTIGPLRLTKGVRQMRVVAGDTGKAVVASVPYGS